MIQHLRLICASILLSGVLFTLMPAAWAGDGGTAAFAGMAFSGCDGSGAGSNVSAGPDTGAAPAVVAPCGGGCDGSGSGGTVSGDGGSGGASGASTGSSAAANGVVACDGAGAGSQV